MTDLALYSEIRWTNFTVRKFMYWKMNIHLYEKYIHLLCLTRCFKHTKTCKLKRFIRRKEFVIDNPVYTLKQVSTAFYFDFAFLVSETMVSSIRDSDFFFC